MRGIKFGETYFLFTFDAEMDGLKVCHSNRPRSVGKELFQVLAKFAREDSKQDFEVLGKSEINRILKANAASKKAA